MPPETALFLEDDLLILWEDAQRKFLSVAKRQSIGHGNVDVFMEAIREPSRWPEILQSTLGEKDKNNLFDNVCRRVDRHIEAAEKPIDILTNVCEIVVTASLFYSVIPRLLINFDIGSAGCHSSHHNSESFCSSLPGICSATKESRAPGIILCCIEGSLQGNWNHQWLSAWQS